MSHPYLPKDLLLPHYVENDRTLPEILGGFFGFVAFLLIGTWIYTGTIPHLKNSAGGKMKMCWFISCGLIHTVLEGYFSVYHKTFPKEQDFLAQMCKFFFKQIWETYHILCLDVNYAFFLTLVCIIHDFSFPIVSLDF